MLVAALTCFLATALAVPAPEPAVDASRFSFYDMPTPLAGPCDLCVGPDGALWGEDIIQAIIFRIDPETYVVEEYPIPFTLPVLSHTVLPHIGSKVALACAIRPGADGNIYASAGIRNQMVQVNVQTKKIKVFTPPPPNPLGNLQPFNDFVTNGTGMFFSQTTGNVVSFFDYATEKFTSYPVPGSPLGMIVAADNNLWVVEFLADKIAKLDTQTGKVTEYDLPLSLAGPAVIRAETEKKYIWFTALIGNGLGRVDITDGSATAFTNPSLGALPAEDTKDKYGNIWFSTTTQDVLGKFIPKTEKFEYIKEPKSLLTQPVGLPFQLEIAINYGPGNAIWFTEAISNRVGRYQLK